MNPIELTLGTLGRLPAGTAPAVPPQDRQVRVLHLGLGAFHRAHQAAYTEDAGDWGICAVSQRTRTAVDRLAAQDGLYSLTTSSPDGASIAVIGAIREVAFAPEPDLVVARMADPVITVMTLTVTEKGYRHDPATGRLRLDDPEIAADRAGRPPGTVVGRLVAGLRARQAAGGAPLTVVCCDNMSNNGPTLARLVTDYLGPGDDGLRDWIAGNVTFPATMVDRITPATTEQDRARARDLLGGVDDAGAVVAEPFTQWVIQDSFAADRPAWERAGAIIGDEATVTGYENAKLRMLNGTHSALAYLGALDGQETIATAVRRFGPLAHRLMTDDTMPTLDAPKGLDLAGYRDTLLRRFANPALRHRTLQIAMDGSQKLPPRLLEIVRARRGAGATPGLALFAVAAWMRFVSAGRTDRGAPITVDDPLAERIAAALRGTAPEDAAAVVDRLLALDEVFGDLADDAEVRTVLIDHLGRLTRDGASAAAAAVAG